MFCLEEKKIVFAILFPYIRALETKLAKKMKLVFFSNENYIKSI